MAPDSALALASPAFSLFAFAELREVLEKLGVCRIVLPALNGDDLGLTGTQNDRAFRNRLQIRWLARECAAWIRKKVELRAAPAMLPQSVLIVGKADTELQCVVTGNCSFTTEGLGVTPGNQFSLIQCSERPEESAVLGSWFTSLWNTLPASDQHKAAFLSRLQNLVDPKAPSLIFYQQPSSMSSRTSATNWTRNGSSSPPPASGTPPSGRSSSSSSAMASSAPSTNWSGSAAASSPTASASARPSRRSPSSSITSCATTACWCSCPKRLRDNWTLYKANDRRNILAADRFNYDVLNHTDLSRDGGTVRRHRPGPRQLGQLRPRGHRRVAQLPQQADATRTARPVTTASCGGSSRKASRPAC